MKKAKTLTKILLYPVTIEACEEGGYFANCPSLQGCHAEGETYSEVIDNIEDVIKSHIKIRKKHNEFMPEIELKKGTAVSINLPVLVSG